MHISRTFGTHVSTLAVVDSFVYVVRFNDVYVYKDTHNGNFTHVSTKQISSNIYHLASSGNTLIAAAYNTSAPDSLIIFDIIDRTNPIQVGITSTNSNTQNLSLHGHYAYLQGITNLEVFDFSNPAAPSSLGSTSIDTTYAMSISGNYLFLTSVSGLSSTDLRVLDISNPATPTQIASTHASTGSTNITVSGNYAYLAIGNYLRIYNISNPSNPELVSTTNGPFSYAISVAGDYAYTVDMDSDSLTVYNIHNPANPTLVKQFYVGSISYFGGPFDVHVIGNYAYVNTFLTTNLGSGATVIQISCLPPRAGNDTTTAVQHANVTLNILNNDSDADGTIDSSSVDIDLITSGVQHTLNNAEGEWSLDNFGNLHYIPASGYNGNATLTYKVKDNEGNVSNTATVFIHTNFDFSCMQLVGSQGGHAGAFAVQDSIVYTTVFLI
jgi:hypothetical protein